MSVGQVGSTEIRSFADAFAIGIVTLDAQRRVILWNRWIEEHSGIAAADAVGKEIWTLFSAVQGSRLGEAIDFAIDRRMPAILSPALNGTLLNLYKDVEDRRQGVAMRHLIHVVPLSDQPGAGACLLEISDMTAAVNREQLLRQQAESLRQANVELERAKRRIDTIIGVAPFAILMLNRHGLIEMCNTAAESILGYLSEELCGQSVELLVPGQFRGAHAVDVERYMAQPTARRMGVGRRLMALRKDGSEFPVEVGLTSLVIDGETKVLATMLDIAERAKNEDELARYRSSLEKMVEERTAEAVHARNLAERANQAKSVFLNNISHEFKTPLHAVMSFSKLGQKRCQDDPALPPKLAQYFDFIYDGSTRLSELIHALLDLASLDSGRRDFVLNNHPLVEIVNSTVNSMRSDLEKRAIKLDCDAVSEQFIAYCDAERIGQVLRHLLSNALQYSKPGSPVAVRAEVSGQTLRGDAFAGRGVLQVTVIDHGVGIPADELDSIFDAFVQSSRTRTSAGGKGVGLALCRLIIEGHGGRIWASSDPQAGTQIHFTIPCAG